jgi:NADPH:quinone reductase-like Zn-dependent oxidoreductase
MKAAYFTEHGGPEVLTYGDVPDPVAGPGEIVIDVHAASVNAADCKVRSGESGIKSALPYVLGRDFSGVISAIGAGVDGFQTGDPVFGVCDVGQEGAYAEKVAMDASLVAPKSATLSHVEAAALAATGLTALITIEDTLHLKAGETILIQGGAGGVAGLAIQVAKHHGAHVITTASPTNHDYLRALGVDQIIDYTTQDFTKVISDIDAVFDTVGGAVADHAFDVLKPGGRAAFIASGPQAPQPQRKDVVSLRPQVNRDRPHLERIVKLVSEGVIKIPEIATYPLSDAAAAHRVSDSRHLRGKLVLVTDA